MHKGLTHQIKNEDDEWDRLYYDLEDTETRRTLYELKFACQIGYKRYRICSSQAGFCRTEDYCPEWTTNWYRRLRKKPKKCKKWEVKKLFIHQSRNQFLIAAGTECMAGW